MNRKYDQEHVSDDITIAKVRESHARLLGQLDFDAKTGLADIHARAKRDPWFALRRRFARIKQWGKLGRWNYTIIYLTAAAAAITIFAAPLLLQTHGFGPGYKGLPGRPESTGGPPPMGHIAYQPPFLPIMFFVDANRKIKIDANARMVTPLGNVTVGHNIVTDSVGKPLRLEPADVTQLIICQKDSAEPCDAYQISTGRKIRIEMNGLFVQDAERSRIVIEAAPGSTIKVTDDGPPTKLASFGPARIDVEEFRFQGAGEETDVDLERSRSGTTADLSYDHITGELKPINGAKVALYRRYISWGGPDTRSDYPGEQECLQKRPEDWRDAFSKDDLNARYSIFCIKTAEGDIGFLFIEPDTDQKPVAYYVYAHTWVR